MFPACTTIEFGWGMGQSLGFTGRDVKAKGVSNGRGAERAHLTADFYLLTPDSPLLTDAESP